MSMQTDVKAVVNDATRSAQQKVDAVKAMVESDLRAFLTHPAIVAAAAVAATLVVRKLVFGSF